MQTMRALVIFSAMSTYNLINMLKIADPSQPAAVGREAAINSALCTISLLFSIWMFLAVGLPEPQRVNPGQPDPVNQRLCFSALIGAVIGAVPFMLQAIEQSENSLLENTAPKNSMC